jgi:hypothetical protein
MDGEFYTKSGRRTRSKKLRKPKRRRAKRLSRTKYLTFTTDHFCHKRRKGSKSLCWKKEGHRGAHKFKTVPKSPGRRRRRKSRSPQKLAAHRRRHKKIMARIAVERENFIVGQMRDGYTRKQAEEQYEHYRMTI